jgi:hypothetical protein
MRTDPSDPKPVIVAAIGAVVTLLRVISGGEAAKNQVADGVDADTVPALDAPMALIGAVEETE